MASLDLADRWARNAVLLGADEHAARVTGQSMAEQYERPPRHYHTAAHACRVADAADELARGLQLAPLTRQVLAAAALAHDVVYDGRPGEDEAASAGAAERALLSAQVSGELAQEVSRLIRTTATHQVEPGDQAGAALTDADLSILGSPPAEYDRYVLDVRAEYAHVSESDWRSGRAEVLRGLLERSTVFVTEPARQRWEEQSRLNLRRELAGLHAPPAE